MVIKQSMTIAKIAYRLLWIMVVLVMLLMAIYVSVARYYLNRIDHYQQRLLAPLAELSGLQVKVSALHGDWSHFFPTLTFERLIFYQPDTPEAIVLSIDTLQLTVDPIRTLLRRQWQVDSLILFGMQSTVERQPSGDWQLVGYSQHTHGSDTMTVLTALTHLQRVEIRDSQLQLRYDTNDTAGIAAHGMTQQTQLYIDHLSLNYYDSWRRLRAQMMLGDTANTLDLLMDVTGDLRDITTLNLHGYIKLDDVDLTDQQPLLRALGLPLQSVQIDSEWWFQWQPTAALELQGILAAPQLLWDESATLLSDQPLPSLEDLRVRFLLTWDLATDQYTVWVDQFSAHIDGRTVAFDRWRVDGVWGSGQNLHISMDRVNLAFLTHTLLALNVWDDDVQSLWRTLSPMGVLRHVHMAKSMTATGSQSTFVLQANMQDVALSPGDHTPGVQGVSGFIQIDPSRGRVELDTPSLALYFPTVYQHTLHFGQARTRIDWQVLDDRLTIASTPIVLQADHGLVTGLLHLDLPRGRGTPWMTLLIGMQEVDVDIRQRYIPYTLSETLRSWLDSAIVTGRIEAAGFVFHGSLQVEDSHLRTVQLFFDIDDVVLDYHPDWPALEAISGGVVIDNHDVHVQAQHAKVLNVFVDDANVRVDNGQRLTVDATMVGQAHDALRVVTTSPGLRRVVGPIFDQWQLEGDIHGTLHLDVPLLDADDSTLNDGRVATIQVDTELGHADLSLGDMGLQFNDFSGPLSYHSDTGLLSVGLVGQFYDKPAIIKVRHLPDQTIQMIADGSVGVRDVADWLGQPLTEVASGETAFQAIVTIHPNGVNQLVVKSHLVGVTLALPEPYYKTAQQAAPLELSIPIGERDPLLWLNLADRATLYWQFTDQFSDSALLILDDQSFATQDRATRLTDLPSESFTITGHVHTVDVAAWEPIISRYKQAVAATSVAGAQSQNDSAMGLQVQQLHVKQLKVKDTWYQDLVIDMHRLPTYWQFSVVTSWLDGQLFLPNDESQPLSLSFDRLVLNQQQSTGKTLSAIDPRQLINADVRIDQLFIENEAVGELSFIMSSDQQGLLVEQLVGNFRGIRIGTSETPAMLRWYRQHGLDHTAVRAPLTFDNLGDVLKRWHYEDIIVTEHGEIDLALSWPGRPNEGSLSQATGYITLSMDDGRFLKTSEAAEGALKVVSIMNFANLVRRLQLDFSDLYDKGIHFDQLHGEFELEDAQLSITKPLLITSPSSRFQLQGSTDVETQQLDMTMIATLPVAGNLPWVAGLAIGWPVAAGALVASQLFKKQIDRFSSVVYNVGGTWDNPQLDFKQFYAGGANANDAAVETRSSQPNRGDGMPRRLPGPAQ